MQYFSASYLRILLLLAVAAAFAVPATAASCPAISLSAVSPSGGAPGDAIVFSGGGYCASAENFFAWGTDGSRGFGFTVEGASPSQLQARLGDVHAPLTGTLRLWFGQRVQLPDSVVELETGIYHIHDSSILLPLEAAVGPSFSAQVGTASGATSELIDGELWIDLGSLPNLSRTPSSAAAPETPEGLAHHAARQIKPTGSEHGISVMVVVRTNGSPGGGGGCGPDEDPQQGTPPTRWVHFFEVDCYGFTNSCQGSLGGTMRGALGRTLAPMGISARTEGSSVVLSHCSGSIDAGFATLTADP